MDDYLGWYVDKRRVYLRYIGGDGWGVGLSGWLDGNGRGMGVFDGYTWGDGGDINNDGWGGSNSVADHQEDL